MVTTLSPCWFCSGLVRQFGISRVVIGEARTFYGGHDWLAENGVEIVLVGVLIAMLGAPARRRVCDLLLLAGVLLWALRLTGHLP